MISDGKNDFITSKKTKQMSELSLCHSGLRAVLETQSLLHFSSSWIKRDKEAQQMSQKHIRTSSLVYLHPSKHSNTQGICPLFDALAQTCCCSFTAASYKINVERSGGNNSNTVTTQPAADFIDNSTAVYNNCTKEDYSVVNLSQIKSRYSNSSRMKMNVIQTCFCISKTVFCFSLF